MRLAVLGFGLIGGSIARALAARDRREWQVVAWSRGDAGPRQALRQGIIAARAPDPATAIRDAQLVVLAAPPAVNLELVDQVGPLLARTDATLSDVTSVQAPIARAAAAIAGLHFVGGHPMSGRERAGYGAASADLFRDRPWVVMPGATAREIDRERVAALARACGALPVALTAEEHDAAVAAISHLPLLASLALVETATGDASWPLARSLAAGGWRDMTRLARGDPALGAGILAANAGPVKAWLGRYRAVLDEWHEVLDALEQPQGLTGERTTTALVERLGAIARSVAEPEAVPRT